MIYIIHRAILLVTAFCFCSLKVYAATIEDHRHAEILFINRVYATKQSQTLEIDKPFNFGDLQLVLRRCQSNQSIGQAKQYAAFLEITNISASSQIDGQAAKNERLFSGWLYAPDVSYVVFESPVYHVWLKTCL